MTEGVAGPDTRQPGRGKLPQWRSEPGHRRILLTFVLLALAVPVFAFVEAGFSYLETVVGASENHFLWTFTRYLVPWAALALLMPAVIVLSRRFPLTGPHPIRHVAIHALASVLIGATHLYL